MNYLIKAVQTVSGPDGHDYLPFESEFEAVNDQEADRIMKEQYRGVKNPRLFRQLD